MYKRQLFTESGSPLTESESLLTESGSRPTESRPRLIESQGSDGSTHPNERESGEDVDAKVKADEDPPLSHGERMGKGKGKDKGSSKGDADNARAEGVGSQQELPPPKEATSSGTCTGLGEDGGEGGVCLLYTSPSPRD